MKQLPQLYREARKSKKWSIAELHRRSGVSKGAIGYLSLKDSSRLANMFMKSITTRAGKSTK